MLLWLLYPLHTEFTFLNVFKYISFRTFGAMITSVALAMVIGPIYISMIKRLSFGQAVRDDGPQSHLSKKGTPTMGGGLILLCISFSTLLWADLSNRLVWVAVFTTLGMGVVGYLDDYLKVIRKNPKGLKSKQKLLGQLIVAGVASYLMYTWQEIPTTLTLPFLKGFSLELGVWYVPFALLVIIGASNAVNLTDGLDGLAVGPTITTACTFLILAYCAGNSVISEYLQIPYIAGAGELSVFLGTVAMACLGFLWFNTYPAQIFMGDVGALALGGALGVVAVQTKNEILLALCGGIFVLEALSVMAQVISFKTTGKRVFKMAPIHHHFELKGWAEPKVIVRFWIISVLLAIMTLATLKLR